MTISIRLFGWLFENYTIFISSFSTISFFSCYYHFHSNFHFISYSMSLFSWAVIMHSHKKQIFHKTNISLSFTVALFPLRWPEVIWCIANVIERISTQVQYSMIFVTLNEPVPILSILYYSCYILLEHMKLPVCMNVNQYMYFKGIGMHVTFKFDTRFRSPVEDIHNSR